jgi:hypothetical protein
MHEDTSRVRLFTISAMVASSLLATSCIQEQRTQTPSRLVIPPTEAYEVAQRLDVLPDAPIITQTSISNSISIDQLGTVQYDGFTLPILSRETDRQYIAVQTSRPPSNDVLLARGGAGNTSSRVSILACSGNGEPELVREHTGGVLLGRTANREGVLVEKANPNGSRWIGIAPWDGGDVRWLLFDGNVNAFGWINDDSTLVYAQHKPQETRFELVVRHADGSVWRLHEPLPYSWLYPIISPDGEGLYALRKGDGIADIAWGSLDDEEAFRESLKLHRTSDRIDGMRARQTLASTTGGAGLTEREIAWFSWEFLRMILWDPRSDSIRLLPQGSVAATRSTGAGWLVTLPGKLERAEFLTSTTATSLLFPDPWVARPGISNQTIIILASGSRLQIARLNIGVLQPEDIEEVSTGTTDAGTEDDATTAPTATTATTDRDARLD